MSPPPDAHPSTPFLGPHVVGQRVVVRRVLPGRTGPTGGPAMTDVLGVCTAWGEGRCVVAPEDGPEVEIRLADIVSGKPVPPRPSPRLRVSVREAEQHTLHLWRHLRSERLGEWVLRTYPTPTERLVKRANSCLAIGDPGMDLAEAAERVRAFYTGLGRPVLAQVEAGAEVEAHLERAGWRQVPGGDAHFLLASLPRALRTARRQGRTPDRAGEPRLEEDAERATVTIGAERPGSDAAARGRAVLDGDWLAIHGLTVAERHRRRGLATATLVELLEWGAERGATTVWLHVETGNEPALALYDRLGFSRHHTVRYLTPGE